MDKAEEFREAMAARFGEQRPARYPQDLRALALEYLTEARRDGAKLVVIAKALGIDANTLRAWAQREHSSSAMQRVVVRASAASFVVVSASGLRCECATVEDGAALMRAF